MNLMLRPAYEIYGLIACALQVSICLNLIGSMHAIIIKLFIYIFSGC